MSAIAPRPVGVIAAPRPTPPDDLIGRPVRHDHGLLGELLEGGATAAVLRVALYLDRASRQYRSCGNWIGRQKIAADLGLGLSTVCQALKWLADQGYIHRATANSQGRTVTVTWCLWLIGIRRESNPRGPVQGSSTVDPGHGGVSKSGREAVQKSARKEECLEERERNNPPQDNHPARERTHASRTGPGGGGLGGGESAPPLRESPEIPEPALAPEIATALEDAFANPGERKALALRVPGWLAEHPAERIIHAIGVIRQRRLQADVRPITDLPRFFEGVLRNRKADEAAGLSSGPRPSAEERARQKEERQKVQREAHLRMFGPEGSFWHDEIPY